MTPEYADFAREEFEVRYARTRSLMAEQDIDALFVTERLNYQYFTGHRSEQCAVDKIRSYMFILPKDAEPTLITMPVDQAHGDLPAGIQQISSPYSDLELCGSAARIQLMTATVH